MITDTLNHELLICQYFAKLVLGFTCLYSKSLARCVCMHMHSVCVSVCMHMCYVHVYMYR